MKKWWTRLGCLLLALVLTICGRGMNLGLDFAGGLSMPYDLGQSASQPDVAALLGSGSSVTIQGEGKNDADDDRKDLLRARLGSLGSLFTLRAFLGGLDALFPLLWRELLLGFLLVLRHSVQALLTI